MYSPEERITYLDKTIEKLKGSNLVEGIVQIGSGVVGFSDKHSDIDLMIATSKIENAETTKNFVHQVLSEFNPVYIKEKQFSKDIFLLIAFLENNLEFNISIAPRDLLVVRSPLWKVIVDKTGLVLEKMNHENEEFNKQSVKYDVGMDVPFEFTYCVISLEKALKRNNLIYAVKVLEMMRTYTLIVQALNENKKLHQFKAYDTLEPTFVEAFLSTYPIQVTTEDIVVSVGKLYEVFSEALQKSSLFSMDSGLKQLMKTALKENHLTKSK